MKRMLLLGVVLAFVFSGAKASASVIGFDDISAADYGTIPDGYGDLDWYGCNYINVAATFPASGAANGLISGQYVGMSAMPTDLGTYCAISGQNDSVFSFVGAHLTAMWRDNLAITAKGYRDGEVLFSETVTVSTDQAGYFAFNFNDIDYLLLTSSGGVPHTGFTGDDGSFVIDDFAFVPEPTSFILFLFSSYLAANRKRA